MAETTKIEWTQSTWNPVTGCSITSPGCNNCYAMKLAGTRLQHHPSRAGLTKPTNNGPVWTGEVRFNEQWLDQPIKWKKPRDIFVVAHGDLFHEAVPDEWIDKVFAVMALAPHHRFQVLTKRPDRMRAYMEERWQAAPAQVIAGLKIPAETCGEGRRSQVERECEPLLQKFCLADTAKDDLWTAEGSCRAMQWGWPLVNVWLGTSVERQQEADQRREHLAALAQAGWNTWVSYEPALGLVDWAWWDFIKWFVGGGESGTGARPSHPHWHRAARDFCVAHGIPYFFKQWGTWLPWLQFNEAADVKDHNPEQSRFQAVIWDEDSQSFESHGGGWMDDDGADGPDDLDQIMGCVGKKAAGHLLDGQAWRQIPEPGR